MLIICSGDLSNTGEADLVKKQKNKNHLLMNCLMVN